MTRRALLSTLALAGFAGAAACDLVLGLDKFVDGICQPGDTQECGHYSGPPMTENVGVCHGPVRICADDGQKWSPCKEVIPKAEDCSTPEDENCDGQVNEASS